MRPVTDDLPEFAQADSLEQTAWRRQVTVRHLLTHSAGLPSGRPFHRTHADVASASERRALVITTPLTTEPGRSAVYSDLGMIILGELLTRIANQPLDQLARELIFTPLQMHDTTYKPACGLAQSLPAHRTKVWFPRMNSGRASSMTKNTRWLGGVAGHAGLFANISDLLRFAVMMLQGGQGPTGRFLKPETIALFTSRAGLVPDSSRCLGWDSRGGDCPAAGEDAPPECFGHGGFTGVSIWFNPKAGRAAILLTKRRTPTAPMQRKWPG